MRQYIIRKNTYSEFVSYEVFMNNRVEYCYYEKSQNEFIDKAYIIVGNNNYVGQFLENSIYVFCSELSRVSGIVLVLKQEFLKLDYTFVLVDSEDSEEIQSFLLRIGMSEANVITLEEYLRKKDQVVNSNGYQVDSKFVGSQNSLKGEKLNWNVDKGYVDYNGFNEQLIDRNVRKIVQFKKGNGDSNEL